MQKRVNEFVEPGRGSAGWGIAVWSGAGWGVVGCGNAVWGGEGRQSKAAAIIMIQMASSSKEKAR